MTIKLFGTAFILLLIGSSIGWGLKALQVKTNPSNHSFTAPISKTTPYVVSIYTYKKNQHTKPLKNEHQAESLDSLGSGVIIKNGYILTNKHLISNTDKVIVVLNNQQRITSKLVGSDSATDLAVLQIPHEDSPKHPIETSNNIQVGDIVLAIGSPYGLKKSVTMGIISALSRSNIGLNHYENFIQTDAAINPGNSGGALINNNGELIGINSAIFSNTGGSQGIGFAIPIADALYVMHEIIKYGKIERGYLGIKTEAITPEIAQSLALPINKGLLISKVDNMSPAQEAGIQIGDIIVKINDMEILTPKDAQSLITKLPIMSKISVIGIRGNQSYQANITIERFQEMGHSSQYY
ncbi:trypsin-like peptidase domain-containing protein [Marinomonas sp. 15G1-11]|uniref:Trypsin-like peptidase domain-containing protein n=1 Tax=Marinomonas phaeophyticola TaxID=3004091 RepID=A0ABT4JZ47_9GAMM|nr:trypsin-like peptidase domain-containing protein [Marinomonas sp. 15G1-11]MCZ2723048.1 trypsin-like peptidase domain-containing protein [Marinomonas sp. 15G1-11]